MLGGLVLLGVAAADRLGITDRPTYSDFPVTEDQLHKSSNLSSALAQIVEGYPSGAAKLSSQVGSAVDSIIDGKIKVIVEASVDDTDVLISSISNMGASVETSYGNLIQVESSIELLPEIANLSEVGFVRLPVLALPGIASEGLDSIGTSVWHDAARSGSGVKVAIIDGGFAGYQNLQGSELPEAVTIYHPQGQSNIDGWGPHGAACAEIVHDVAPDAEIYLAYFSTEVEWLNAVDWLIEQKVDVVSHSVSWMFAGPGDGTGWACEKISEARNEGILWVQTAGNYNETHWQGRFSDMDEDTIHNFTPHDETNRIWLPAGRKVNIGLRWDDPWNASMNDYDLFLLDSSGSIVASSTNLQDGDDCPMEMIESFVYSTGWHAIQIKLSSGNGAAVFDLFTAEAELEHQSSWGSILDPGDASDAFTVGAFRWNNPDTLEDFSGRGPTGDNRTKPDIAAPDGVTTASYDDPFYGTSAAVPHVAGAAALLFEEYTGSQPAQVQAVLEARAINPITAKNNVFGSGRLSLEDLPLIVHVDDNLPDDPQNHIFNSITEGINHAGPGDIVKVESGIYKENVSVDKPLVLEGKSMPVIDARLSGSAVSLAADGCTLRGFDLRRGGWGARDAALQVLSSGNKIEMLTVRDSWNGVLLWSCSDNLVGGIAVRDNFYGASIFDGESNMLCANTFLSNDVHAWANSEGSLWDNGVAGNFWDDYEARYPSAVEVGETGVWDTSCWISGNGAYDEHPLVETPFQIKVSHPVDGSGFVCGEQFILSVNVLNAGPLAMEDIAVTLISGEFAEPVAGGTLTSSLESIAPGSSGTLNWALIAGPGAGQGQITAEAQATFPEIGTLKAEDAVELLVTLWDPWIYDTDTDGVLEYEEMAVALLDYINEALSYEQMLAVLLLYLPE